VETSFQAQVLIPMATSLCFGLILGTVLILYLVPTFYMLYHKLTHLLPARDEQVDTANIELPPS